MFSRLSLALIIALVASALPAYGLVVPFTEDFSAGNASWLTGSSSSAPWSATGGVDGGGHILSTATMTTTGFGAPLFRGNASSAASAGAFVGNWLSGGVSLFSAFIKHDAPVALQIFARLDAGGGAAASSVFFNVPSDQWFQMSIPIVNSPTSFQSYGAAGPAGFSTVFSNIQNVQFFAATNSPSGTYGFSLDRVSVVPEPRAIGLIGMGALLLCLGAHLRRASAIKS